MLLPPPLPTLADAENIFTAEKLTLVSLLLGVIYLLLSGKLVPGTFYNELKEENRRLREKVDELSEIGRQSATTAQELSTRQRE